MEILVCAKQVPETAEADIKISAHGRGIEQDDLVFDINEWDLYAVEAALQLVEAHGGSVTVVTMGDKDAEDTLRRALAMGCAQGVHLLDRAFEGADGHAAASALAKVAAEKPYDLILCGVQAADDGLAWTGPALAAGLGIPWATMVTAIEKQGNTLEISRELEGGMEEELILPMPCVLTVQSGINEPRYVSVMGIRKVRKKPLDVFDGAALGLESGRTGEAGSRLKVMEYTLPPAGGRAQMIEGMPTEQAAALADILADKGGLR